MVAITINLNIKGLHQRAETLEWEARPEGLDDSIANLARWMPPYATGPARGEECESTDTGGPADAMPEGSNRCMCQVVVEARAAVAHVSGARSVEVVTLDFTEGSAVCGLP